MAFVRIFAGILSAAVTGALTLFTLGEIPAVLVAIVILGLSIYGVRAAAAVARLILALSMLALVGSLAFGGFSAFQLYQALSETSGPPTCPIRPRSPGRTRRSRPPTIWAASTSNFSRMN